MRNGFLALITFVMSASAAPAQNWAEKLFVKDGVPHLTHDFGSVPPGMQLTHAFPVTNIYAAPIEISSICVSPSCVQASVERYILAPRQSTFINVCMDARRFTGKKTVAIYVEFWSTAVMLQVSANSREEIIFDPGKVQFDVVPFGQTPSRTLTVHYAGKPGWQVTKVTTPAGAPFDATIKETYRRPDEVGYQLTATLKAGTAPGSFREDVILETNDPDAARLVVPVQGTVEPSLTVAPANVNLGAVKVGEVVTTKVLVRSNKPFLVLGIEGPAGIKLEGEPNTKARPMQTVTFQLPPALPVMFPFAIKIKTDLRDAPLLVVVDGVAVP